jgi:hypothetical protein
MVGAGVGARAIIAGVGALECGAGDSAEGAKTAKAELIFSKSENAISSSKCNFVSRVTIYININRRYYRVLTVTNNISCI